MPVLRQIATTALSKKSLNSSWSIDMKSVESRLC